ncbi:MAG: class I SAM-dependent methyltransferase, partial [Myxococcaceae bacterium]
MADYIHGSTDEREVARLEKQARYVSAFSLRGFTIPPGARVLDFGTGVGAMAQQLLDRYPGIHLTGVDLRASQLEQARKNHPGADYVQADGTSLPFADATFDVVHASWVLEHVPSPQTVLAEVFRVLKPGGRCRFIELDNKTLRVEPADAEAMALLDLANAAQIRAGGDPFIGPKLKGLFETAGF